ncbi:MAG: hypothetical protein ACOY3Y_15240, partial [Acidobacteriota bacterium]
AAQRAVLADRLADAGVKDLVPPR